MNDQNLNFFLEKVPSYIIIILPVLFITGSFLPDLAVVICSICFLINCFKQKYYFYFRNKFFYFFILFYLYLIFSSLQSSNILHSLHSSLFFFRLILFSLCVWHLLEVNSEFILKKLFYVLGFVFILLLIDGTYQYYNKYNIFGFELINNRVSSFFGSELIMGSFLSRIYPIFIGLYFFLNNKKKLFRSSDFIFYFVIIAVCYLILISGERTSFFYFTLSFLFLSIINFFNIKKYVFIIFCILVIILLNKSAYTQIYTSAYKQIYIEQKRISFFSKVHEEHYESALRIFNDNKFFGAGPRSFRLLCNEKKYKVSENSCTTHPHSTYIQLLAETGLIGFGFVFFAFMYIIFIAIKIFFKKNKINNRFISFKSSLLAMFLITLWPLAPSGNFFHNWLLILYFYPVGFYLWLTDKINKN
jgi:O-antigen ligase